MKARGKNVLAPVEGQQAVDGQEQRSDGYGGGGVSGSGASPKHRGAPRWHGCLPWQEVALGLVPLARCVGLSDG